MTTPTKPALPEPSEPSKLLSRVLHELAGAATPHHQQRSPYLENNHD